MAYLLGYIADRVGVPSMNMQTEKLIEYGVLENDIYKDLNAVLGSLREGGTLVVYTAAIFGRNKINNTFTTVCRDGAKGIYSLKTSRFYDCQLVDGMEALADAWSELDDVQKKQMGETGKAKGGRKRKPVWKKAPEIKKAKAEGVTWTELEEIYGVDESTLRRIVKNG